MNENYAVIIVTYNRLALLKECLEHVENQTVAAKRIIVVDNASGDGTARYLAAKRELSPGYTVISSAENIGGAGGFEKGIEYALSICDAEQIGCVLLIDDDAMIGADYMEKIMGQRKNGNYHAFAGIVETDGAIDIWHRRRRAGRGIKLVHCPCADYEKEVFECDVASFCGMVVDMDIVRKIGLPCGEYFIWNDDVEYSLRINRHTKFLVVTSARLDHRAAVNKDSYPHRRYDWREYYGIRNRLLYVRKHGTVANRLANWSDMFVNIVFRNWLFGILRMDGYDWKYENMLVRKAYSDAKKFYNKPSGEPIGNEDPEGSCEWGGLGKSLNTGR